VVAAAVAVAAELMPATRSRANDRVDSAKSAACASRREGSSVPDREHVC
jgi:hypothetical protein